jgi:DNA polymerase-3 subunit alpha
MPQEERLKGEKELLGLYLSDHPLRRIEQELHARIDTYANELTAEMEGHEVRVGGVVKSLRPVITRSGKPMAFVQLEDLTSVVEVIVFPRTYEDRRALLEPDTIIVVHGKVDARGGGDEDDRVEAPKVIADEILAFDDPQHAEWVRNQVVHLDVPPEVDAEKLDALQRVLSACPGPDRVVLHLPREHGIVDMELGERFRVQGGGPAGERAQREVNALFGRPVWRVEIVRKKAAARRRSRRRSRP